MLPSTQRERSIHTTTEPLAPAKERPTAPVTHAHTQLTFHEPENREGEVPFRPRNIIQAPQSTQVHQEIFTNRGNWDRSRYIEQPVPETVPATEFRVPTYPSVQCEFPRQPEWWQRKANKEDETRKAMGQPPKRRKHDKNSYHYQCTTCGLYKSKQTGHSQVRGKCTVPTLGRRLRNGDQDFNRFSC